MHAPGSCSVHGLSHFHSFSMFMIKLMYEK